MCNQHVTVVAAGGGAGLNFFIYSFIYRDTRYLGGHEMINGRGKKKNIYLNINRNKMMCYVLC